MPLSARNRLSGDVKSIDRGETTAEVRVELTDGQTITATITNQSVDNLDLSEGETVDAVIKATEVMIDSG